MLICEEKGVILEVALSGEVEENYGLFQNVFSLDSTVALYCYLF